MLPDDNQEHREHEFLRVAVHAIRASRLEPSTGCREVDGILRRRPDADPDAIDHLLCGHDLGDCRCSTGRPTVIP